MRKRTQIVPSLAGLPLSPCPSPPWMPEARLLPWLPRTPCAGALLLAALLGGCAPRPAALFAPSLAKSCGDAARVLRPVVLANYNIKSALLGSLEELGTVLEDIDADVIALQEVDRGMGRSGREDQSLVLAQRLGMERVFVPALARDGGEYGIALLTKLPIARAERVDLPPAFGFEPRVAVDVELCAGEAPLRVVAAHGVKSLCAATAHAHALADILGDDQDVVVLGDLNAEPDNEGVRRLIDRPLSDALGMHDSRPTFGDSARIDYILTDRAILSAHVVEASASDHRPVTARLGPALASAETEGG